LTTAPEGPEGGDTGGAAARDPLGRRFVFRLAPVDMIAYEMAVHRLDWRTRVVLTVMVGIAGLTVAALPAGMPTWLWWTLAVVLLAGAVAASVVYTNLGIRRRVRAHVLPAGDTTVELRPDAVFEAAGGRERAVPYAALGGLVETPGQLFLKAAQGPVVLPLAAFEGADDMAAVAEWLRDKVFRARREAAARSDGN